MKILIIFILSLLLAAGVPSLAMAVGAGRGIGTAQSPHNFSHESWLPVYKICIVCHIPHKRKKKTIKGLPWDLEVKTSRYTLYDAAWSSSLTGIRELELVSIITRKRGNLPDGISKLCLGCHNGIIAPEVFKLHHFISREFDLTKSTLNNPNTTKMGLSGLISEVLEFGKVQCSSCHDVHDEETVPNTELLRKKKDVLCITCHKK